MPCDSVRAKNQTFDQRKTEVRGAISALASALMSGRTKVVIDKATGAVAFQGWTEGREARISDACGYRLLMATGSALAKQAVARAEQLAGRTVSRQALAQGVHAHEHDGHLHWHHGH